jgi:hypothetical protein
LSLAIALTATVVAGDRTRGQTTVSFQEGVGGYAGSLEVFIGLDTNDIPNGVDGNVVGSTLSQDFLDGLYHDRSPASTTGDPFQEIELLMRYDNIFGGGAGQIPLGSKITSATLTFTTGDGGNAQSNGPYGVAQITALEDGMPWQFDSADTWTSVTAIGTGSGATYPGGHIARPLDKGFRGPMPASDGVPATPVISKSTADVTRMVQNWSSGQPNQGFLVRSGTTDGWQVFTSGAFQVRPDVPVEELRPKLTVTYEPAPAAPSTTVTLQQNVGGYVGTTMAWLQAGLLNAQLEYPGQLTTDGATIDEAFLDGANLANDSPDDQALIKFGNIFASQGGSVPDGATILDAQLIVDTAGNVLSNSVGTNGNFGARQMLADWTTSTLFTDFGGNGPDQTQGEVGPVLDTTGALIADARTYLDVTSAVKNWKNGQPNYGLLVEAIDTADGWAIKFLNSSSPPQLQITYSTAIAPTTDADFDDDGDVDGADLLVWQRHLGTTTGATLSTGDANADGAVNAADLAIWQMQFPAAAVLAAGVPEPSSLAISASVAAVVLLRRRYA